MKGWKAWKATMHRRTPRLRPLRLEHHLVQLHDRHVLVADQKHSLTDSANRRILNCNPIGASTESQLVVGILMRSRISGRHENFPLGTFNGFHIAAPPQQ